MNTAQFQNLPGESPAVFRTDAETMNAIVQRAYGKADVLRPEKVTIPSPGEKEVLIEVHAAAIDLGTWHLMTGTPYLIRLLGFGLLRPKQSTPGFDVAGKVVATGSGVSEFETGDEVFGIAKGSCAEYTVADEGKLVHKPVGLKFEDAAAVAISGITAFEALTDIGEVQAGQHVLVVGASGGVGTYAVQIAKALGAKVTGVASAAKADLVWSLGADHVIDYKTNYLVDNEERYDLIIDIGGRNKISHLRNVLTDAGTLVFVGGEGGNLFTGGIGRQIYGSILSLFVKQHLKMFIASEKSTVLKKLCDLVQSGAVMPAIDQCVSLEQVPQAMHRLQSGSVRGKIVIGVRI